ncbi:tyrosine-type recombinase/integrase [Pseudonocardia sp. MH-G8]|uniref:tyrosine-type recombinase/integrase n=1 Tax=Pseudonocardia sp. MH-G8 TaxID=1854588 RepID=UPI000B9FDD82|nr:tyrosine-type recombinase/integrase [Pseudonocardia sp. MH-G8]OZM76567.1 multidrug DMT transporter permease [Pseudonocardia sp. MH-G8]
MSFVEKTGTSSWRVRFWRDDGTHGSIPGFPTKKAAEAKARAIDTDRQRGAFTDPDAGNLPLAEWIEAWFDALDVAPTTLAQYRSLTRNHILPRWGTTRLNKISGIAVTAWVKKLRADGYASATVTTILKLLNMMLADAADERLIPANPIRPHRRGRRRHETVTKAVWARPEQALQVALNSARLAGPATGILMLTAAWTGARWGELTGLHRDNTHLHPDSVGRIVIAPDVGALHEVDGRHYLGPPKTAESAREITLPPFLTELLHHHLAGHRHPYVFVAADGAFLRRSNFSRRAMRPAADGTIHRPRPAVAVPPAVPRLTFHGFRHSHKTWMIADHIPEVAQSVRLGHRIPDKIQHVYSHVAPELDAQLLDCLQRRWIDALATLAATSWTTAVTDHRALPRSSSARTHVSG